MPTNTTNFTTEDLRLFWTDWGARFYAWRARRHGFKTSIRDYGKDHAYELDGRYEVTLTK